MTYRFVVGSTREFFASVVNPEMSREGEEKSRIDCDRYIPFLRAVKECMERASSSDADSKEQLRCDLQRLEKVAKSLPHTPVFDALVNAMVQLVSSTLCWRCVHARPINAHIRTNKGRVPKERPFSAPPFRWVYFADTFVLVRLLPKQPHRITGIYSSYSVFIPTIRNLRKPPSFEF